MRPLTATELLDAWERGRTASPLHRALLLLALACPEWSPEQLAQLPLGRRDALLLRLRAWTFGPHLDSVVDCPACGERLEFTLDSRQLAPDAHPPQLPDPEPQPVTLEVRLEGQPLAITLRLPTSQDLAAALQEADPETDPQAARDALLRRCLLDVQPREEGQEQTGSLALPHPLPKSLAIALAQALEAEDPLADLRLELTCPACEHAWQAPFDILGFFWQEIDDWAWRMLREVHLLARSYGWSQEAILSMSAWRRRIYLEMVQA